MNILYLALGALLLALAVLDLLWTTLWVDGGSGPLSSRLMTWLWRGLRQLGSQGSRTLTLAGPLMLTGTMLMWVTLLGAGWTFLFAGGEGALIDVRDDEHVTWAGRIYFVAYSLFTLGNGDFTPKDGFWQIATGVTTASGMLFVTLAVSYVLSVLEAVAQKRSFASGVTGLGMEAEALLLSGWNGHDFHGLNLPLNALASQLDLLADQHNTFPILHYYHSDRAETASAVAVVVLDEALTLLRCGIPEEDGPAPVVVQSARSSVQSYLRTLNNAFIEPADSVPPTPDLSHLRRAGIPTLSDEMYASEVGAMEERRRKLLGLVRADAWEWPQSERSAG